MIVMQREWQQKKYSFKKSITEQNGNARLYTTMMCFGGCLTACQLSWLGQKRAAKRALAVFAAITCIALVRKAAADTLPTLEYESSDIHMCREVWC